MLLQKGGKKNYVECQGSKSVFGMLNAKFDIQYNFKI